MPNSTLWQKEKSEKVKSLCDGSNFSDKIQMLGIVEATFGGQEGYLQRIVDGELINVVKSGAAVEREAQRLHH